MEAQGHQPESEEEDAALSTKRETKSVGIVEKGCSIKNQKGGQRVRLGKGRSAEQEEDTLKLCTND